MGQADLHSRFFRCCEKTRRPASHGLIEGMHGEGPRSTFKKQVGRARHKTVKNPAGFSPADAAWVTESRCPVSSGDKTMTLTAWLQWLKGTLGRQYRVPHYRPLRRRVTPRRSFVPSLNILEDRTVPSGQQNVLYAGAQGTFGDRTEHAVRRFDA